MLNHCRNVIGFSCFLRQTHHTHTYEILKELREPIDSYPSITVYATAQNCNFFATTFVFFIAAFVLVGLLHFYARQ